MHANASLACRVQRTVLAVAITLSPLTSFAQSAHTGDVPTVGDIDDIQSQTFKQKALLSLANVNSELAKKNGQADISTDAGGSAPNCSEVYGANNHLKVVFLYSDGSQVTGRQGETIAGGWKVLNVSLDKVQIERAGKVRDCGFSASSPASLTSTPTTGAPTYFLPPPATPVAPSGQ